MTNKPCPICRKARSAEFAPFCSSRCRDRDLNHWLSDGYAVPGRAASPDELVDGLTSRNTDTD